MVRGDTNQGEALHTNNGIPRIPQRRNRKHLAHANKGENNNHNPFPIGNITLQF
jgi:hypothetical protein